MAVVLKGYSNSQVSFWLCSSLYIKITGSLTVTRHEKVVLPVSMLLYIDMVWAIDARLKLVYISSSVRFKEKTNNIVGFDMKVAYHYRANMSAN